jgi:hypothetical protein
MLLCLGQGEYYLHDVLVESTSSKQIDPKVFTYKVYTPAQHKKVWGTIQSDNVIHENVVTSPEVENQELTPAVVRTYSAVVKSNATMEATEVPSFSSGVQININPNFGAPLGTFTVTNIAGSLITVSPATLPLAVSGTHNWFNIDGLGGAVDDHTNKTVTITYFDASKFPPVATLLVMEVELMGGIRASYDGSVTSVNVAQRKAVLTYTKVTGTQLQDKTRVSWRYLSTSAPAIHTPFVSFSAPNPTGSVGPFSASAESNCTAVFVNIVFPNGLYKMDQQTGNLLSYSVTIRFTITPIDVSGVPNGAPQTRTETITRATNTPQRMTFWYTLPKARYQVAAERVTTIAEDTSIQDRVIWTGLCAILDNVGLQAYGDTTMMVVRVKATNGISNSAVNRIGVRCSRKDISTVAAAYKDIVTNPVYGAARAVSELDTDAIDKLTAPFNGIFDFKSSVWEALVNACAVNNAKALPNYAKFSAVIDAPQSTPKFAFSVDNIVKDSVEARYLFDAVGERDGFEVEYRDPVYFQPEYSLYPSSSVDPQSINLFGCTDAARAADYAKRMHNRREYRRKWVAWSTELEGHLPQIGDLVSVDHPLLGGKKSLILNLIEPDEDGVRMEGFVYDARVYA